MGAAKAATQRKSEASFACHLLGRSCLCSPKLVFSLSLAYRLAREVLANTDGDHVKRVVVGPVLYLPRADRVLAPAHCTARRPLHALDFAVSAAVALSAFSPPVGYFSILVCEFVENMV